MDNTTKALVRDAVVQVRRLKSDLQAIEARLLMISDHIASSEADSTVSTDCPPGFETIVQYLSRNGKDIDAYFGRRLGGKLAMEARARGVAVVKVKAPPVVVETLGCDRVNAYPTYFLDMFIPLYV